MKFKINSRYSIVGCIAVLYLIPILFFSSYSIGMMALHRSWLLVSLGILLSIIGALVFQILLRYWEAAIIHQLPQKEIEDSNQIIPIPVAFEGLESKVSPLNLALHEENEKKIQSLQEILNDKENNLRNLQEEFLVKSYEIKKGNEETSRLQKQLEKTSQDYFEYKIFSEEQLAQKSLIIQNLQNSIHTYQHDVESKQEKIDQFESKIRDLSYEIKTLLQLNENDKRPAPTPPSYLMKESSNTYQVDFNYPQEDSMSYEEQQIKTSAEALLCLKRCLETAQKITGSSDFHRQREMSLHNYAIDLRRLFDSLRGESSSIILVYSQKEDKLLFVNNQSKTILGWNPEKFIQDFQSIVQQSVSDWKKALSEASFETKTQTRLLMKTKNGNDLLLECLIGMIPSGLFKTHLIGVLYPGQT